MNQGASPGALSAPVRRFCSYTTAHGLGRFSEQSSLIGKLIWISFLLLTYGGFAYHLSTLFDRFLQAPVITNMNVSTLSFKFPDVYICPARAVTASKMVQKLTTYEIEYREYISKKSRSELIDFYNFQVSNNIGSDLNEPTKAFLDVIQSTEESLMDFLQVQSENAVTEFDCRISFTGEDYTGNASSAAVYGFSSVRLDFNDSKYINYTSVPSLKPYITYRQCMSWNDAARILQSRGGVSMADRLFSLNFSDVETRCRSPPGLPLSAFFSVATRPKLQVVGCFLMNETISDAFNFTCYRNGTEAYETCAECCDKYNFPHTALMSGGDCYCGNFGGFENSSQTNCTSTCANSKLQSCGSGSVAAVLQIRDADSKPMHIGNFSNLAAFTDGPYCFYSDVESGRLNAALCDVPYCPISKDYDCIVSTNSETKKLQRMSIYTGWQNETLPNRECVAWSLLQSMQKEIMTNRKLGALLQMHIQTPDGIKTAMDNHCRSVSIVIEFANDNYTHFERQTAIQSEVPTCFPQSALRFIDRVENLQYDLFREAFVPCDLSLCYLKFRSVTGAIRDSVGRHLLARQFGSDLSIGLAECSFAGQKCTEEHFVNIDHPQLGMCHQFLSKKFTANMTSTQLAQSQLSIMYFTDSTDSKGHTAFGMGKLNKVVHESVNISADSSNSAFKAIIVPEGAYPWAYRGIVVTAAQRMNVQLRLDRYFRLPTASRPCLEDPKPIKYRLPSWNLSPSNDGKKLESAAQAVISSAGWNQKIAKLIEMLELKKETSVLTGTERQFISERGDCFNSYVLQKFADHCKCLPSFLPIPMNLFVQYSYCFDIKDISNFSKTVESCYNEHAAQIQQYTFEAIKHCESPCRTDDYSVRYVTYPWPNLKTALSIQILKKLASNYGYRTSISGMRGLTNIYQTLLKAQSFSETPTSNQSIVDRLDFNEELEALQNRLAWLTVEAWSSYSQDISEEEAYPAKNLLADIGGTLGLWSGVSILTICELLELLFLIGRTLVALKSRGNVRSETNSSVAITTESEFEMTSKP